MRFIPILALVLFAGAAALTSGCVVNLPSQGHSPATPVATATTTVPTTVTTVPTTPPPAPSADVIDSTPDFDLVKRQLLIRATDQLNNPGNVTLNNCQVSVFAQTEGKTVIGSNTVLFGSVGPGAVLRNDTEIKVALGDLPTLYQDIKSGKSKLVFTTTISSI